MNLFVVEQPCSSLKILRWRNTTLGIFGIKIHLRSILMKQMNSIVENPSAPLLHDAAQPLSLAENQPAKYWHQIASDNSEEYDTAAILILNGL